MFQFLEVQIDDLVLPYSLGPQLLLIHEKQSGLAASADAGDDLDHLFILPFLEHFQVFCPSDHCDPLQSLILPSVYHGLSHPSNKIPISEFFSDFQKFIPISEFLFLLRPAIVEGAVFVEEHPDADHQRRQLRRDHRQPDPVQP